MHYYLIVLSTVAGICFALGILHLFTGLRRQADKVLNLTFALFALSYAGGVLGAARMYSAASLSGWMSAARWDGVFIPLVWISISWYVAIYTGVRPRLFLWLLTAVFVSIGIAHLLGPNMTYGQILELAAVSLPWGETLAYAETTESVWSLAFIAANLVSIGFALVACVLQYRRGERQPALALGAGMVWFIMTMVVDLLVDVGIAPLYVGDFGFLGLAIVASLQMSNRAIRTEEELARYREYLGVLVQERTAELERANIRLEEEVSERQRAAEALGESEARYRGLVEEIQEIIYAVDERGVVTYVSPAVVRLLGYSVAEVVGRPFSGFVSGEDLERLAGNFERLRVGAPSASSQYRLVTKEGQIRWVQPSSRPIWDGDRVVGLQGVLADVTDRVLAEEALRQRVDELAILNQVAQVLAGVTELPLALQQTSELINHLYDACFTFVVLANADEIELEIRVGFERAAGAFGPWPMGLTLEEMPASREVLAQGEPLILADLASLPMPKLVREYLDAHGVLSLLLVPLVSRGEVVGILAVGADQDDRRFTPDQIRLAETIAGDVASAVENARLSEQAQALAVNQERGRIARDLHDSVTQTIYSASLVAESLPRVWERNPGEARDALRALQQLMRGGLAELRTLLFELRADAFERADLDALLHQLADVLTGRTRALVEVTIQGPTELPPEIKVALYRIAQEALNNVAKHAHATEVGVTLQDLADRVVLSVQDDGRGFDPASLSGQGLGMSIIHERAERIGATIEVDSAPGRGTRMVVIWPRAEG